MSFSSQQINESGYSEIYLNYYDIFVAFGNYFDILKEVAYSPMMAEMLSYLNSRSSIFVLDNSGSKAYPGVYNYLITSLFTTFKLLSQLDHGTFSKMRMNK